MPPRIPSQLAAQCCRATITPLQPRSLAGLLAALSIQTIQTRNASILSNLSDNPGAHQKRIRLGRGPSSGKGKTSGRGHKGQKQHGKVKPWFQGGQTPLIFQRGRLGFENLYVTDVPPPLLSHPLRLCPTTAPPRLAPPWKLSQSILNFQFSIFNF